MYYYLYKCLGTCEHCTESNINATLFIDMLHIVMPINVWGKCGMSHMTRQWNTPLSGKLQQQFPDHQKKPVCISIDFHAVVSDSN